MIIDSQNLRFLLLKLKQTKPFSKGRGKYTMIYKHRNEKIRRMNISWLGPMEIKLETDKQERRKSLKKIHKLSVNQDYRTILS